MTYFYYCLSTALLLDVVSKLEVHLCRYSKIKFTIHYSNTNDNFSYGNLRSLQNGISAKKPLDSNIIASFLSNFVDLSNSAA